MKTRFRLNMTVQVFVPDSLKASSSFSEAAAQPLRESGLT